ncbi:hypothetical protein MMC07_004114 [Pseudocyphellaria aurata]|nr:hypothetical protein [Pseudocyphellaria aurata]
MAKTGPTGLKASGNPTNRSRYEDTSPKPSTSKPSSSSKAQVGPSRLPRIQPVTPLVRLPPGRQNTKDRAVTDPIIPQPLVVTKKISNERNEDKPIPRQETFDEKMPLEANPPSMPVTGSDGGSEIILACPVTDNSQGELSLSAPAITGNTLHPFYCTPEERSARVPVQPYRLRQANWPTPAFSYSSIASNPQMSIDSSEEVQGPDLGMIMGDGMLNPTRTGTYARVGEVGIVHHDVAQRVSSQAGVIETLQSPGGSLEGTLSQLEGRPPSSGVWENHPNVGRSLPPYSSGSPRFPPNPNAATQPPSQQFFYPPRGQYGAASQLAPQLAPELAPTSVYSTSWMTNSRGNSYSSDMAQPNPVPPPPLSYPGFQPSAQIPAVMEQMERNLHHHMDQCFASLSRVVTDKPDRITDRLAKEFESSDDKIDGVLKSVKGELRELQKEALSRHKETKELLDSIREQVGKLDLAVKETGVKMDALDKKLDEVNLGVKETGAKMDALDKKLDEVNASDEQNDSEREILARPRYASTHRRTESARPNLGQSERRQRRRSPSRSPTGLRQGGQTGGSSRGRQATAENGTGTGALRRVSARARERNFLARLGEMRGPPPALSEHPAYRREREERASSSERRLDRAELGPNGSDEEGWFHQAYRQRE